MQIPKRFTFISKKRFFIPAIVIIMTVGFFLTRGGNGSDQYETATVSRGLFTQAVTVSGKVNPKDKVSLSFEQGGRVASLSVNTGDTVTAGAVLASLSNLDLVASLDRSRATLLSAQAALAETKRGSRPEEIAIKEAELEKAKQDLTNYYEGVSTVIADALDAADDALSKRLDPLFSNDNTSATLTFLVTSQSEKNAAEDARKAATGIFANLKASALSTGPSDSPTEIKDALRKTKTDLEGIRLALVRATDALNVSSDISATTLASYKADVATSRSAVTTAITGIETRLNAIVSGEVVVKKIEDELRLEKAGATTETIAQAEARVAEALADVKKAEASLAKTILRSPINGVITNKEVSVGQIVAAQSPVFSVISAGDFEVIANIPEVDIAKVAVGNTARVTLDAYSQDEVFLATVSEIDPAERIIDGIATYQVTLTFNAEDPRIRSGMTANTSIETTRKEDTVFVPERAITNNDGKKTVRLLTADGTITEQEVTTGLRGLEGTIEITSGLSGGETVVTFVKE